MFFSSSLNKIDFSNAAFCIRYVWILFSFVFVFSKSGLRAGGNHEKDQIGISDLIEQMKALYTLLEYNRRYSESEVEQIINEIKEKRYVFSPMRPFYLPKPNKPGELRPITAPANRDRLVYCGLLKLMHAAYDASFSEHSHGFLSAREGP